MKTNKIFKTVIALASASVLAFSAAGCSKSEKKENDVISVSLVQPMSHTSLDQIRDTIISELEKNKEGLEFNFSKANANGDMSSLATIFENERSKGADIVVPIATPTAQSAKTIFEEDETPIVYAAVSDPVAAGLTGDDCKNITGVSDAIAPDEILSLISDFQPDFKKIGFLFTSTETNSVSAVKAIEKRCDEKGISYKEAAITNISEVPSAVANLVSEGVDAFYTDTDNTIASAMATYTDAAYENKIPVYCGADSMVSDGGFATKGVDYVQLGKQVANMIIRIAKGEKIKNIPYETLSEYAKFVNLQSADKIGIKINDDVLKNYKVLVEKDGTNHFGK